MTELSVGILTADLLHLADEFDAVARAGVTQLHVDVIDGVFCPGLTVGARFVAALPESFRKDVHLMVDNPEHHFEMFSKAGADSVTAHVEILGERVAEAAAHARGLGLGFGAQAGGSRSRQRSHKH